MESKHVTKGQIGRIVQLLVADKVPFDEAQAFIVKFSEKPVPAEGPNPVSLAFWNKCLETRGNAVARKLEPFVSWHCGLKPQAIDLSHALKAIFWRKDLAGLRVFSLSEDMDQLRELHAQPLIPLGEDLQRWQLNNRGFRGQSAFYVSLSRALREAFPYAINQILLKSVSAGLGLSLLTSFEVALCSACEPIIGSRFDSIQEEIENEDYSWLFRMWLLGNYPIGFDGHGNLLVLVA
jgi:hypothetical protein